MHSATSQPPLGSSESSQLSPVGPDRTTEAPVPALPTVDSSEMSMRRTGMSFQRTRMSADRTLMSVIRTSLSLISFGFTIYQVFAKLSEAQVLKSAQAARNFGV